MYPEWISVEDELPLQFEWVLISFIEMNNPRMRFVPSVGEYRNGRWSTKESDAASGNNIVSDFEADFNVKVTHWMPLPRRPN